MPRRRAKASVRPSAVTVSRCAEVRAESYRHAVSEGMPCLPKTVRSHDDEPVPEAKAAEEAVLAGVSSWVRHRVTGPFDGRLGTWCYGSTASFFVSQALRIGIPTRSQGPSTTV